MDLARVVALPEPLVWSQRPKIDEATIPGGLAALDRAEMILWGGFCGVHTIFSKAHVDWWKARGWKVLIHPESPIEAVQAADGSGSTDYLWKQVMGAPKGAKLAIGTEGHFVRNAREQGKLRGVEVMHLADIPDAKFAGAGCGCATMSRNDPPHLAGMLDLLRKGTPPDINRVLAGDAMDERTAERDRLGEAERKDLVRDARRALERMIEVVESAK
jgi:quinolinate synthase